MFATIRVNYKSLHFYHPLEFLDATASQGVTHDCNQLVTSPICEILQSLENLTDQQGLKDPQDLKDLTDQQDPTEQQDPTRFNRTTRSNRSTIPMVQM